jgi:hypothetical protein
MLIEFWLLDSKDEIRDARSERNALFLILLLQLSRRRWSYRNGKMLKQSQNERPLKPVTGALDG